MRLLRRVSRGLRGNWSTFKLLILIDSGTRSRRCWRTSRERTEGLHHGFFFSSIEMKKEESKDVKPLLDEKDAGRREINGSLP